LAALLFLYRDVLKQKLDRIEEVERARISRHMPVVLTRQEVSVVLRNLSGTAYMAGALMYGSGLRLMECLRLRVKDVDFSYNQVWVRSGKGGKDRITPLPATLKELLRKQLLKVKLLHQHDLQEGFGEVDLPYALKQKLPNVRANGRGSICFLLVRGRSIQGPVSSVVIIFTKALFKKR
jgi:integrase